MLWVNLAVGIGAMMLCLMVQAILLLLAARYFLKHRQAIDNASILSSIVVLAIVMLILVAGNLLQGVLWAWLFMWLGEFTEFSRAYYFSLVNFATLGYGDIVMSDHWRLLGPIQAINGVLMIGITTGSISAAVKTALEHTIDARRARVGLAPLDEADGI